MKKNFLLLSLLFLFFVTASSSSAEQILMAVPISEPPYIDGLANDPAWENAPVITTLDKAKDLPINIKAVYNSNMSLVSDSAYRADVWFWKACRTDGIGYADDKIHEYSQTENRNATKIISRSGKTMYLLRASDEGKSAYKIDLITERKGDILPRYTFKQPTGSRSDIQAKGVWQNGKWTIELGRKLVTSNQDDIQFVPGRKYLFGISRYEIADRGPNAKLSEPLYGAGDINEALWLQFMQ
jgi:hypothetical protein